MVHMNRDGQVIFLVRAPLEEGQGHAALSHCLNGVIGYVLERETVRVSGSLF